MTINKNIKHVSLSVLMVTFFSLQYGCAHTSASNDLSKMKINIDKKVNHSYKKIRAQINKKSGYQESGTIHVDRVVDGDTFKSGGKTYRLVLVDTPETVHPTKGVQPYGKEASHYSKQMLTNKDIKIEYDIQKTDKYGRDLVYVWLDGKNYNAHLIKEGYARMLSIAPNTRYLNEFKQLESDAKSNKKGLWQYTNY